jgi:hypothetical protein
MIGEIDNAPQRSEKNSDWAGLGCAHGIKTPEFDALEYLIHSAGACT